MAHLSSSRDESYQVGGIFKAAKIVKIENGQRSIYYRFSFMSLIRLIVSIGLFVLDYVTDVLVAIKYYRDGDIIWFIMIIALMCCSAITVQVFSIMWSTSCCDKTKRASHNGGPCFYVSHIFCLSQIQRKLYLFYKGMKRHTERHHSMYLYDLQDAYLMDLVESFIESAPQVILQMYILLNKEESDTITTLSVLISGVTVASSLVQYNKTLREAHYPPEQRLSVPGIVTLFIWRYLFILCRSVFLGLFGVTFSYFIFVLMGCHWFLFTFYLWYTENGMEQFPESALKRIIYCIVGGFIYIYCVFNLKNGKSRGRYVLYYIITILEMAVAMMVWFIMQQLSQMRMFALMLIIGGYFFGFMSMAAYYILFHPSRLNYLPEKLKELTTTQYYYKGAHEFRNTRHDNESVSNQITSNRPQDDLMQAEARRHRNRNNSDDRVDEIDGEKGVLRIGERLKETAI